MRDLFERSTDDLLGRRLTDLLGQDAEAVERAVAQARGSAQVAEVVLPFRRAAGETRWIEIRCAPLAGDTGVVAAFRDITLRHTQEVALRVANSELNRLAGSDALTDLANRRRFDQMLETECRRASRHGVPVSLLLVEVDDFRSFSDLHGHAAGDECLRRVAGALRASAAQPAEMVARLGGEEFALLLPQADETATAARAAQVRASVAALGIPHSGCRGGQVSASVGSATLRPSPDTLAKAATMLFAGADQSLHAIRRHALDRVEREFKPVGDTGRVLEVRAAPGMDQIARIAAMLLGLPVAFVVQMEDAELVIAGHHGLDAGPIAAGWCARALQASDPIVVPDTGADPAFRQAREDAGWGFLAAAPLSSARRGSSMGALWVADRAARTNWGENESLLLVQLAGLAAQGLVVGEGSGAGPNRRVA